MNDGSKASGVHKSRRRETGYFELLRKSPFPIAVSAHIVFRLIRIGLAGVLLTSSSSGLAHE